jgi:hypothetical protein
VTTWGQFFRETPFFEPFCTSPFFVHRVAKIHPQKTLNPKQKGLV